MNVFHAPPDAVAGLPASGLNPKPTHRNEMERLGHVTQAARAWQNLCNLES